MGSTRIKAGSLQGRLTNQAARKNLIDFPSSVAIPEDESRKARALLFFAGIIESRSALDWDSFGISQAGRCARIMELIEHETDLLTDEGCVIEVANAIGIPIQKPNPRLNAVATLNTALSHTLRSLGLASVAGKNELENQKRSAGGALISIEPSKEPPIDWVALRKEREAEERKTKRAKA